MIDEPTLDRLTSPGRNKLWALISLGWALPLFLLFHAMKTWLTRESFLPGRNGGIELFGDSARWMAVALLGLALFCNARSWWGAKGFLVTHQVMMKIACLIFIVGFFGAVVCGLAGI